MACYTNGAAHTDGLSGYAALGWDGRGGDPRRHGGYFGSSLNFEVDQK